MLLSILLGVLAAAPATAAGTDPSMPHLRRQGTATPAGRGRQAVPDPRRRARQLHAPRTPPTCEPSWPKFAELNLNTVLAPVYWDLVEPEEGRFDFSTVDRLVADARANGMRLVLLWFGSWKNSMSCYAPAWVKRDARRFPRATDLDGTPQEILSPFSAVNRDADARAFAALLKHLREIDGHGAHRPDGPGRERDRDDPDRARPRRRGRPCLRRGRARRAHDATSRRHREELAPELRAAWRGGGREGERARGRRCSAPGRRARRSSWPGTSRATRRPSPPPARRSTRCRCS